MIGLDKDLFFDSLGLTHTSENIQCSVGVDTLCTNMYTRVCSSFEFQVGNSNQSTKVIEKYPLHSENINSTKI